MHVRCQQGLSICNLIRIVTLFEAKDQIYSSTWGFYTLNMWVRICLPFRLLLTLIEAWQMTCTISLTIAHGGNSLKFLGKGSN